MTGSLLQIVSTDLKDAFLTIDPQITFFKIVYLRHTPFSIDLFEETFNTIPNFGEEGFCQLSKLGDLVSNIFLKVELPSVQIENTDDSDYIQTNTDTKISYYNGELTAANHIDDFNTNIDNFKVFSSSAMVYWRQIYSLVSNETSNYNTIMDLIDNILLSQNNIYSIYQENSNDFSDIDIYIDTVKIGFNFDLLDYIQNNFTEYKESIYNTSLNTEFKDAVIDYLDIYLENQKLYLEYLITSRDLFVKISDIDTSSYYYFAWVKKLAFALISSLSIELNGQQVDSINGDILNMWYELSTPLEKIEILNKMIGNIELLTDYNTEEKPNYTLIIPLPFWFCKYKSQALPCVGLKYSDIIIKVKFNDLTNCCYFEPYENSTYSSNVNINDIIKISNVSLLVEYIHLGDVERNKFGSFTIESLIEQHRLIQFSDLNTQNILLPLDFVNPIREIIWTIQKTSNVENFKLAFDYSSLDYFYATIETTNQTETYEDYLQVIIDEDSYDTDVNDSDQYVDGTIEIINSKYYNGVYKILEAVGNIFTIDSKILLYSDNFTVKLTKSTIYTQNRISTQTIQIYGQDLISKRDSEFFSLVVPFKTHTNIPLDIYCYSFCLNSEQFQPSGSLNFNVIDSKNLYVELNSDQIANTNDSYIIKIISRSHNILKIENGSAKTQFGI